MPGPKGRALWYNRFETCERDWTYEQKEKKGETKPPA